jgi:hypothetical protein
MKEPGKREDSVPGGVEYLQRGQNLCSSSEVRPRNAHDGAHPSEAHANPHPHPNPETLAPDMMTNGKTLTQRKILRAVATLPFVTVCALAFGFTAGLLCLTLLSPDAPGTRDYVFYWATGQQLVHHADPYDLDAMKRIERSAGFPARYEAGLMRNPPSALPLVYPLGFVSARVGWVLWSFALLACLLVSIWMLWVIYGRPRNRRYLLGLSFAPALVCLNYGQTSLFALLGLVLFLRLHRTRPFLAGVSLWLCALKPQLFLPFGAALLGWILVSKSYKLLAGAAAAMATSCAIAFLIDPLAWTQYSQMMRSTGIESEYIPCLSFLLRNWISPNSIWLQYLPAALGSVWALAYFWQRRQAWDWLKDGSPLMLVSILAAPYSWIYDQGLVLPALLQGAFQTRFQSFLIALAFLSALVEVALFRSITHHTAMALWTYWSAPAWLAWYILADKIRGAQSGEIGAHQ